MGVDLQNVASASSKLVAAYTRISVNKNGERDESLETQLDILTSYIKENELGNFRVYTDNDETGVYFDRPGLVRMTNDINNKRINTIVVKDLSRLGRNDGETLVYLDFLKEKNVRIIAIGDNYDSSIHDDEVIGIKTWVNEYYARDISRKVRANLKNKMQKGEYMAKPHFGYLKSDQEKNRIVVDECYRGIIQEIFDLYVKGWGYRALADHVHRKGIPTPSADKNYVRAKISERWNEQHIRRIITNRVYCGDTVQGVSEKVSFKSKKTRRLPPEKWVVVENTHEAVISRETFELAQRIRHKRWLEGDGRKKKKGNEQHLFSGFLVCAACGTHFVFKKKKGRPARYMCGKYNKHGREGGCTNHHVLEDKLIDYLIEDIQQLAEGTVFQDRLASEYGKKYELSSLKVTKEVKRVETKITEKRRQQKTVYLDKVRGVINEELFIEANTVMEKEIAVLEASKSKLQDELAGAARLEEDIKKIRAMKLQVDKTDIDRVFLEKYLKKIISIEDGEEISENVREKYGLNIIFTEEQLAEIARKKIKLIILYNLSLAVQKHQP